MTPALTAPAPAPRLDDAVDDAAVGAPDAADVTALRARIDVLDAELLRLVHERSAVSARIGRARRAAGGPRIVHARENEVVGRWRTALGRPGAAIALALLELGRGPA
ncbi:MAG TPA: chorismate mutase [Mycobacteriales bacterium]|nr:chorismate mutase [Mycobacteriales bacterium]